MTISPLAAFYAKDYQASAAKLRHQVATTGFYPITKIKWAMIDYRSAREMMGVTDADQYYA